MVRHQLSHYFSLQVVEIISSSGVREEGLFRVPGFMGQVRDMKALYDQGKKTKNYVPQRCQIVIYLRIR